MWKRYDAFRNAIIIWTDRNNFWFCLAVLLSIPGAGVLVDKYLVIKFFGPVIICFYAMVGMAAQIRDLQLLREKHKKEEHEWRMRNLPPYDGF